MPKLQGLEYTFIVFDEAADMKDPWEKEPFEPDWLRRKREQESLDRVKEALRHRIAANTGQTFIKKTPGYTQRPIEPLPEFFCLHFIGGPKTGTEEFWPYRANANIIEQGKTFVIALHSDLAPTIDENNIVTVHKGEQYTYKSTFIPRNETPFSDAQVVICLFQG